MTEQLTRLRFKRGQLKANVTRAKNYFESLNLLALDRRIITELEIRLQKLEPIFDEFNSLQTEIEYQCDNNGVREEEIERTEFETNYFSIISSIKETISKYLEAETVPGNETGDAPRTIYDQQVNVKLPTIRLPLFSGQYNEWLEFRDSFKALINENISLTDIQRFYYLRSALQREALQIIESIPISANNYSIAWQMLEDRFEQRGLLIHSHIREIMEFPSLKGESHSELRNLFDNFTKHLRSLKILDQPVEHWDTLIIYVITNKFDVTTRKEWELYDTKGQLPNISDLSNFLKQRCELLEKIEMNPNNEKQLNKNNRTKFNKQAKSNVFTSISTANSISCYYCKGPHIIFRCQNFLKLSSMERTNQVKKLNLCLNCLRPNHASQDCTSSSCKQCGKRQNTLLHLDRENVKNERSKVQEVNKTPSNKLRVEPSEEMSLAYIASNTTEGDNSKAADQVLLSTAIVHIQGPKGNLYQCRALLDNGSQSNFISERICKILNLNLEEIQCSITGVGEATAKIRHVTNFKLFSLNHSFQINLQALVISKIANYVPCISFDRSKIKIPPNIKLADPDFNSTGPIDILLGATVFWELLCVGQFQLNNTRLTCQKTKLGWIVSGSLNPYQSQFNSKNCFMINVKNCSQMEDQFHKFWCIEEIDPKTILSESEQFCESHFLNNLKRDINGRFIVTIPLKDSINQLGESRNYALQRFHSLEKKLIKNRSLYIEYSNFMREYEELGHMSEIIENDSKNELSYYIPHHAIIRNSSITTKIRVVFDASMKTDTGLSLNDVQYIGPTIQNDLLSIILRFRKYKFILAADISKMYRMVLIEPNQRKLQRIFWRSNPSHKVKCYELNTVTYGTASAPFLAIRCLYQLALTYATQFPHACDVIKNDFYVDDLLSGSDSEEELLNLQQDISMILATVGFQLHKWSCNKKTLYDQFAINRELRSNIITIGQDETNKTLGILWNADSDTIRYSITRENINNTVTKRKILSIISQIFDPLGLLGPIITIAKILMQKLWQAKLTWDEALPQSLHTMWIRFYKDLSVLDQIKIPRQVIITDQVRMELHGFADASERAYGSCIYLRCKGLTNQYVSRLLCAKSRVAPIKQITLPKLELCGALLLARLIQRVKESMNLKVDQIYLWSDSEITLCWLRGPPNKWKTFVANRVSEIQQLTNISDWHHIASKHNPADLISRGTSATEIRDSQLWWSGPPWFNEELNITSLNYSTLHDNLPEQRIAVNVAIIDELNIFNRFSTWRKLQRVISYCLRFVSNSRLKLNLRQTGTLTYDELQLSWKLLIRLSQKTSFCDDYKQLESGRPISRKSKLLILNPFMDKDNLIRIGGRLQNSASNYDKKHPIILAPKHVITKLILKDEHIRLLHCGPTMLLSSIREIYWPLSGRSAARKTVHQCIVCFKVNPRPNKYIMGNLPKPRVESYLPFFNTGCDYAGPFLLKDRLTRKPKLVKGYVCLFICLATKAVHLEAISDLTTGCFLATLKRFIGRRGKPAHIFSDNGKSFIGASTELKKLQTFIEAELNSIEAFLLDHNIQWHFIPPRAPNFGGLWEAGIKCMKHHLKRVIGEAHLNFEDFCTVLIQIEAVLNSRPLCPLTSDPDQLNPLTPAHFLIGRRLTSLPETNYLNISENRLKRYERLQKLVQHFWSRWHLEYLSELQTRKKWNQQSNSLIKIGTIVLLKEPNAPPLKWPIGRIVDLHPGNDGIVQVASVKTETGIVKRALSKLCSLPFEVDNDH